MGRHDEKAPAGAPFVERIRQAAGGNEVQWAAHAASWPVLGSLDARSNRGN